MTVGDPMASVQERRAVPLERRDVGTAHQHVLRRSVCAKLDQSSLQCRSQEVLQLLAQPQRAEELPGAGARQRRGGRVAAEAAQRAEDDELVLLRHCVQDVRRQCRRGAPADLRGRAQLLEALLQRRSEEAFVELRLVAQSLVEEAARLLGRGEVLWRRGPERQVRRTPSCSWVPTLTASFAAREAVAFPMCKVFTKVIMRKSQQWRPCGL